MAQVLLCTDERLGRRVAVKRLYADSPEEVETRFAREARLGALLNHPNLVSVFDTVADADGVLIVMEYVPGEALSRVVRRGPLPPRRVASIARELGGALDHAHGHGVVHRDVKPGNVLLRVDGVTKLADLGIATAVDLTSITRSGEVLGTASYMAPEQLEGREADAASDVYALAAVCYEALAGERARRGRSALEIAHRIATEAPPDIRERLPSVPPASAQALQRGMARDPGERPASAGEFAAEFAAPLAGPGGDSDDRPTERLASALPMRPRRRPDLPPAGAATRRTAPAPASARPVPPPAVAEARSARAGRRARPLAVAALLALCAAIVAVALLSTGGDGGGGGTDPARDRPGSSGRGEAPGAKAPANDKRANREREARDEPAAPAPEREAQPPEPPQPTEPVTAIDPARGAQLNNEGFALMGRGEFAAAVPILQEAVASWPEDSTDIDYAYALFNLGKSLNRAGRPDEAIPYLEKRLAWNDQRATVQAELDLALREAAAE
jgi:serine/threonine-protein kinase